MSAMVRVQSKTGKFVKARALLDTCATAHFITERLARSLDFPMQSCSVPIGAINGTSTVAKDMIDVEFRSIHCEFRKTLRFLTVPKITDLVPSEPFPRERINIPPGMSLADPQFHLPQPVDLLIGSGATLSLMSVGQINLSRGPDDLLLQKTQLGWIIAGGVRRRNTRQAACNVLNLNAQIEKFWVIEDHASPLIDSSDQSQCESHYAKNTTRGPDGRYIVRLPFRDSQPSLGNSRTQALRRFHALRNRLNADPDLRLEYNKVMQEYISLGHMSPISDDTSDGYFMPHHAVVKATSNTTKLRVVFDASAKTDTGSSLNNALLVGPTIQDKLFEHLLKFRSHAFVITADIEKMYRQVLVHPNDRKYQRIFWYQGNHVQTYELNTVTFGVAAAPFLAIRTLHQLADDEHVNFPRASSIMKRDLYVDDLLTGAETLDEILQIRDDMIALLRRGGFNIRQWASNHRHALDNVHEKIFSSDCAIDSGVVLKTLGVMWNSTHDCITYTVKAIDSIGIWTKRKILSEIAKIFDPLGLLGPLILYAKRIMQDCWKTQVGWDESVPQQLYSTWTAFANQLEGLRNLTIDRRLLLDQPARIEIHGFCDASQDGYGACLYVRSTNPFGETAVRLACAKSRVAPLKKSTIPRLELCAALTLVRLWVEARPTFLFPIAHTAFWSDSMIVLHWIRKDPQCLKVFEANRVAEIQSRSESIPWRHIRSKDNPADALSRGQLPDDFLQNATWFTGPSWLGRPESEWPKEMLREMSELPGLRKTSCFAAVVNRCDIFERFSSYWTLVNSIAYVLRMHPTNNYTGRSVSVKERDETELRILRIIQHEQFTNEIKQLSPPNQAPVKSSRFATLNAFMDEHGLVRVGGRLKRSTLPFSTKHPILLPSHHHVTDLIIRDVHQTTCHAGIQATLYAIRQRFWLFDGKNQVRHVVKRCVNCIRHRPTPITAPMGDLPSSRVESAAAFSHVGIDFFGPFFIKERKHRNRVRVKTYGCVYVCMATKAVHIEIVSDLSTEGFLGSFRRFIGRRGIPSNVYSDNGTNFVGANSQLQELPSLLNSHEFKNDVNTAALRRNITWHFNPPLSPHFGGLWEAAVKSFKHHFRRVVGEQLLTFEQLNTLAIEIESILNSRPLCPISADPNDPLVLTPAHLLIGRPLNMLPGSNADSLPGTCSSAWNFITRARQDFWKKWHLEYLSELQKRQRWLGADGEATVNTVVVIMDKNRPCAQWRLGVIIEVYPGSDGVVRVVKVRTANGIFKRNVHQLCPLIKN